MDVRLLCLPFAGAGESFFRRWRRFGVSGVDVHPVQLPGRERRIDEKPYEDVHLAADCVAVEVEAAVSDISDTDDTSAELGLFGHSLGAVMAYEITRRLIERGIPVAHLFVSGSPGPWTVREVTSSGLNDAEFLARVEELAGYRHPAFDNAEMRDLLLPTLRADVDMHENYRPQSHDKIPVPVTALRGVDDELVSGVEMAQWRDATSTDFRQVDLPGRHMYLTSSATEILRLVVASTRTAAG